MDPCPTIVQTVGRPGTGSLPRTIAPPNHPLQVETSYVDTVDRSKYLYQTLLGGGGARAAVIITRKILFLTSLIVEGVFQSESFPSRIKLCPSRVTLIYKMLVVHDRKKKM